MIACVVVVLVVVTGVVAKCQDGYFEYGKGCMPCDSSCKTCSDSTACDSCEEFMRFDTDTSLCTHCGEDEYFDETLKVCRNCDGTCFGRCNSRLECIICDPGKSLDLDTLACVTDCQPSQIEIKGHNLFIERACRSPEYYVDPTSFEIIELGTRKYPYRTMKSVSSEILTFLSHKNVSIIVNVRDVYIEDKTLVVANITEIVIQSHPDLTDNNKKALITPTEFSQAGISKKARFHLLTSSDLPIDTIISAGSFTESELVKINGRSGNMIIRSGLTIQNIDLYREEEDYNKNIIFLQGIYLQNKTASFLYVIQAICVPEDDLIQVSTFENISMSVNNDRGDKVNFIGADISNSHYRPTTITTKNAVFFGYQNTFFSPLAWTGTMMDSVHFEEITFKNSGILSDLLIAMIFQRVTFGNLESNPCVIENIGLYRTNLIRFIFIGSLEISNIKISNVIGPISESLSFISLNNFPFTPTIIQNISVSGFIFGNGGLLDMSTILDIIQIKHINIVDSVMKPGLFVFKLNIIKTILIEDFRANNVQVNQIDDKDSSIFRINSLDVSGNLNSTIENVVISNCGISILSFGSMISNNSAPTSFEMSNITVKDSIYTSSRSIISTLNLVNDADFTFKINEFYSSNVTFLSTGNILLFAQSLANPIIMDNSVFSELESTAISIMNVKTIPNTVSEVSLSNCTFRNISSSLQPVVRISERAIASFTGSIFDSISIVFDRSGIIEASSNSIAKFINTNFTNNAAVISTLLTIQSGAYVECNSCFARNNFGVRNTIFSVLSNGYFKFYDSEISENFGIQTPIGQLFDASQISIFDKTNIHNNSIVTPTDFLQETSGNCSRLCFLKKDFTDYIKLSQLYNASEGSNIIEIVAGSLQFINGTQIYNQGEILNVFMASIRIEGSIIRDISFKNTPITATSSSIDLNNVTLVNIQDNSGKEILLTNDESQIIMNNVTYEHSNTRLFRALSGEVSVQTAVIRNISRFDDLMLIYSLEKVVLIDITLIDIQASSDQSFKIENSQNVSIDTLVVNGFNKTVGYISKSNVKLIKNIQISSCFKAFNLFRSFVDMIDNSTFTSNGKQNSFTKGGAIKITDSEVTINSSEFINNNADVGGAIDLDCGSISKCKLKIENCSFENNSASIQGGSIHYNFFRPEIMNSTFVNNYAQYGANLASYPVKIRMRDSPNSKLRLTNIGSGVEMSSSIQLALLDYDDQVLNLANEDQVGIFAYPNSNSTVAGINSFVFHSGIATVERIIFSHKPGEENIMFYATTKAVDNKKVSAAFPGQDFNNNISVDFRFCEPGEEITQQSTCRQCDAGTYSLEYNSTECKECMDNASCLGRNHISVHSGYWRPSQTSSFVTECLFKRACDGGYTNSSLNPVNCAEGYHGELCSQCVVNENVKYSKVNNLECSKCPDPVFNAFLVFGLCLLVFSFLMVLIILNVNKTKESNLSVLLRIMTNYFQLIFTSLSLTSSYPTSLISFFDIFAKFGDASEPFLSIDCFIRDSEIKGPFDSNAIFKLFLLMLLPLILSAIVTLIWIVIYAVKRKYVKSLQRNLAISFISILFLLHPKLTEQSLGLFRCIDVNVDDSRVRVDTTMKCYSSEHIFWLFVVSGPILIVWVVSLPLMALFLLYKNIKKETESKINQYFLILYQGLKKDKFYWEFINTTRKILILALFVLPTTMKMLVSISILIFFARIQIFLQPYTDESNNSIEILAISAGIITIFSGLLYSQPDEVNNLNTLSLTFCIIINIYFFISWIYLLSKDLKDSSKIFQLIFKIFAFILRKPRVSSEDSLKTPKPNAQNHEKRARVRVPKRRIKFKGSRKRLLSKKKKRIIFSSKNIKKFLKAKEEVRFIGIDLVCVFSLLLSDESSCKYLETSYHL
ncbi:unnamed protein product [Moneuplotes crassus]|uniref:Uncharacterized protein n=1 Tax=Euplotes crassus TaxID=5936 RepID=A0AAD1UGD5_EUPCR|nr:unnamed protein product [Moneuplotes crassus]